MLQISENEIHTRLQFDNPWWEKDQNVGERYQEWPKRSYFPQFCRYIQDRSVNRAIILMGPRRVGKTVMVHHAIQDLLDQKAIRTRILYLSLETPVYTGLGLEQLLHLFTKTFKHKRNDKLTLFFDEIQYLKDWEIHLKSLVDSYPNYKFIVTGSAAAALRLKSRESGAGRFTEFMLPSLTFAEYLSFIKKEKKLIKTTETKSTTNYKAKNIEELNKEFINYLNFGGYPEAVFSKTIRADSARYIKSDIIDKVLLRDLPSLYGINDIQELNRLFTTIAYNTGNEVTLEGLSQTSGVAKNTLKRYLEYLEAAFLIKRIKCLDQNAKHFKRATSFKVYLTNPSMRAALFGYINEGDEALSALTETAVFSQWLHSNSIDRIYYARWKNGEVDIVSIDSATQEPEWCIEVKWSDRAPQDHAKLNSLISFVDGKSLKNPPIVTTKTIRDQFLVKNTNIRFEPVAELVYAIGKNILLANT